MKKIIINNRIGKNKYRTEKILDKNGDEYFLRYYH
jgi:hypothetical protein